jgi:hypothetical protein
MRSPTVIASVIFFVLGWPTAAQMPTVEDHIKRVSSIDASTLTEADCSAQLSKAKRLNSADLLYASALCHTVHKDVEGNFLLSAGQVRGSADMALMAPAAKADLEASAALYGFIFYYAGGPGNIEVLRTAPARDRFFQLFDSWVPTIDATYSPGWNVGKRPDDAKYQETIAEIKEGRRQQLIEMSRLYSDKDYYALQRKFDDLQKRTSGRYVEGTPDAKLSTDLQRRMDRRARELGVNHESPEVSAEANRTTPPSAPGKGETVVSTSADPVVKQCSDWAENLALMSVSKIVRVVMTTGSEWGLVWRADIANSDNPPEMSRFICSQYGTMLESGDGERAPLP